VVVAVVAGVVPAAVGGVVATAAGAAAAVIAVVLAAVLAVGTVAAVCVADADTAVGGAAVAVMYATISITPDAPAEPIRRRAFCAGCGRRRRRGRGVAVGRAAAPDCAGGGK